MTKKILGSASVAADGSFTIQTTAITSIVHPVLFVEDAAGDTIAVIGDPTGERGNIAHYFPIDGDNSATIDLGTVNYATVGGDVFFVPSISPSVYVDTDNDGVSNYAEGVPVVLTAEWSANSDIKAACAAEGVQCVGVYDTDTSTDTATDTSIDTDTSTDTATDTSVDTDTDTSTDITTDE